MITHEEAIEIMQVLESDDAYYNERFEEHKKMFKYITQQEKITELLGLYKSVHGVVQSWDTMPDVEAKIQRLEKELKEGLE